MKKIIIIAFSLFLYGCDTGQAENTVMKETNFRSETFKPKQQIKQHKITAFVEPTDNAFLSFQVSGTIEKKHINIGDVVEINDPLFSIDNPSLGPKIQQFDAEIKALEATINQNQAELSRLTDLKKSNAVSQNDLDRLINQNNNLLAKKDSLKAQQSEAQSMFDELLLSAPFKGTVAEIYKEAGENIASGEPILLLGGIDSLEAPVYLTSQLQNHLKTGQILNANYQGQAFQVSVKEISHAANPKSQLFKVVIGVPLDLGIKSGEQISIIIPEQMGFHYALPISAVIDDGINKPYVMVLDKSKVRQLYVHILGLQGNMLLLDLDTNFGNLDQIDVVTEGQSHLSVGQTINNNLGEQSL
ncbi:efflux RND transporter periplasmic adaptor subunit [Marinicella rhabdoformis]|uniref:efflux RND transporter periplasmic adaptor subunit n=1 Tax=Marinicella rhabdoformis TaxID=2580566 RepID=UPI0012AEC188|nr:efflux RND transporter periplasmic adaptor subunit [Marinicella rhabdoformis]